MHRNYRNKKSRRCPPAHKNHFSSRRHPTTKKFARTPYFSSRGNNSFKTAGRGPSSKQRTIVLGLFISAPRTILKIKTQQIAKSKTKQRNPKIIALCFIAHYLYIRFFKGAVYFSIIYSIIQEGRK